MKILLVNNYHYVKGGAERYYFDLSQLLESKGHQIAYFSTLSNKNIDTKWKKYFLQNTHLQKKSIKNNLYKLCQSLYSLNAMYKISKLLDDFKPDIVHLNNIYYHISPSILREIKKRNIPIVQTIHDYELISPIISLSHQGKICEITKKNKYFRAISSVGVGSRKRLASITAVVTSYVQKIFKSYERNIDVFITPSKFAKEKLLEYGFGAKIIYTLPNFVETSKNPTNFVDNRYILYFGNFYEHKGLFFIIRLAKECPSIKIKIIGSYTDVKVKKAIKQYLKNGNGNLIVIKHQSKSGLNSYIRSCSFTIVPSLWFEVQSYSLIESFAQAKTVVTNRIGGIPEFVEDGITGLLCNPGDYDNFKKNILYLWNNIDAAHKMGVNALDYVIKHHNPNDYYNKIMKIYKEATSMCRKSRH